MKNLGELIECPPGAGRCEICGVLPWQVIESPCRESEIKLCLPCFIDGLEVAKSIGRSDGDREDSQGA